MHLSWQAQTQAQLQTCSPRRRTPHFYCRRCRPIPVAQQHGGRLRQTRKVPESAWILVGVTRRSKAKRNSSAGLVLKTALEWLNESPNKAA